MPAPKKAKSLVLANNDIVYLWWTYPEKIKDCLGFSIHRIVEGVEEKKGLMATVGFGKDTDPRTSPQTTDEWPIQSFNWKDVYAPTNKSLQYRIIPMIGKNGDWMNLLPDTHLSIVTEKVEKTREFGDIEVIFNRGLLSTQAFAKADQDKDLIKGAKGLISEEGNIWRTRLGGHMLEKVHEYFKQDGKFYCALYELSDPELIDILRSSKGVNLILSTSDSNKDSRPLLHKDMKAGKLNIYDRNMKSNSIGHNKFVVYTDKNDHPIAVLTGSTNWTPTGLCGQTNNMVVIKNKDVAAKYLEYWQELRKDTDPSGKALQGADLRTWCRTNGEDFPVKSKTTAGVWFSPNTVKSTKPSPMTAAAIPVDLKEVYGLIKGAQKQVFYLVFNPGTPSIIDEVKKAATAAARKGKPLFVRGAVSDATLGKKVTTNIISKDATLAPDKYRVTGVDAIPGNFGYWEKELLKIGFATIHDKIVVIDPFDARNCVVITGSHNLGPKASYSNDENIVMIKGNTAIAQAYTTHVLDVVNHFKWRYKLANKIKGLKTTKAKEAALANTWNDLGETDAWMDYYYNDKGDLAKEQLLFNV